MGTEPHGGPPALALPPALEADAHKGDAGRCVCFAGSAAMPGAATLVARAAQRAGAGLVRMACLDERLLTTVTIGAPEAVLLNLTRDPTSAPSHTRDAHAWLAGPGMGHSERTRDLVRRLLGAALPVPSVLDADALNVLDGEPELANVEGGPRVLTPHPGEIQRLLRNQVPVGDAAREAAARELAQRSGSIVCLKGHHTVVDDGERRYVNESGNAGMATAGSGDVLAGLLVAYLARARAQDDSGGLDAFALICTAVHVHGRAGDFAAERHGRRAVVASDLIDALGAAQRELE